MKVLLLASASLLIASAAQAQQAPASAKAAPPAAAAAGAPTDAEVSAVATVGSEAKRLQDEAAPTLAAAKTPEDKRKAQYALDDKMEALFKSNNITFERYNAIASQAQSDKALAARIAAAPKNAMPSAASAPASSTPASASAPDVPAADPGKPANSNAATPATPAAPATPAGTSPTEAK